MEGNNDFKNTAKPILIRDEDWQAARLSRIRSIKLAVLSDLNKFCKPNSISYFLVGNTLKGAATYHGFLPDDTKVQLGMLRPDFDRFKNLICEASNSVWQIEYYPKECADLSMFIRLGKQGISDNSDEIDDQNDAGWIEVYPFDIIPGSEKKRRKIDNKIQYYEKRSQKVYNRFITDLPCQNIFQRFVKPFDRLFSLNHYPNLILEIATENNQNILEHPSEFPSSTYAVNCLIVQQFRPMHLNELFPLETISFENQAVSVPKTWQNWCVQVPPSLESIKVRDCEIQKAKKFIIKAIDEVCADHGLTYFAYGKTMIGALYYQDFIPDDNHVDLGMLRDDFNVLIKKAGEWFDQSFIIVDKLPDEKTPALKLKIGLPFGQLISDHVSATQADLRNTDELIWVDLCPFDSIPDSWNLKKIFYKQIYLRKRILQRSIQYQYGASPRKLSKKFFFIRPLEKFILRNISISRSAANLLKYAARYDNKNDKQVCSLVNEMSKPISKVNIKPVKKMEFSEITVSVPYDYSEWKYTAQPYDPKVLHNLKRVECDILRDVDAVCRKHGIGYFICGGTMLGALRHDGFIPWDDDIDIAMLRTDYVKFLNIAQQELGDGYFVQTRKTDRKNPYLWAKVRKNGTKYITNYNEKRAFHKGLYIDIFPFDYIPNDPQLQLKFRKKVRQREKIHNRLANSQIPEPQYTPTNNLKDLVRRLAGRIYRAICHLIPLSLTEWLYVRCATRYNKLAKVCNLQWVASFVTSYTFSRVDKLLPYQDYEFAGVRTYLPRDPDSFLRMQYGNYMDLPPLHKRIGHDLIEIVTGYEDENLEEQP